MGIFAPEALHLVRLSGVASKRSAFGKYLAWNQAVTRLPRAYVGRPQRISPLSMSSPEYLHVARPDLAASTTGGFGSKGLATLGTGAAGS